MWPTNARERRQRLANKTRIETAGICCTWLVLGTGVDSASCRSGETRQTGGPNYYNKDKCPKRAFAIALAVLGCGLLIFESIRMAWPFLGTVRHCLALHWLPLVGAVAGRVQIDKRDRPAYRARMITAVDRLLRLRESATSGGRGGRLRGDSEVGPHVDVSCSWFGCRSPSRCAAEVLSACRLFWCCGKLSMVDAVRHLPTRRQRLPDAAVLRPRRRATAAVR